MEKLLNTAVGSVATEFSASTSHTGLIDVQNKVKKAHSGLNKIKKILKYSIYLQSVLALFFVLHFLAGLLPSSSHWLSPSQLEIVPIVLNERPIRTMQVDSSLVSCAMWKICDPYKHFTYYDTNGVERKSYDGHTHREGFAYSKEVRDLNNFLRKNQNFSDFFAAQGVSSYSEAVANFYSINKHPGLKVPDVQVKQLQQKLELGEYAPAPAKPVKKYLFAIICLIGVFQAYWVVRGRKEVQYTKRLERVIENS